MGGNRLWVLGPSIESILTIEEVLVACGEPVAYATYSGQRVTRETKYCCDGISVRSCALFYTVGCGGSYLRGKSVLRIDPQVEGYPGFDVPPERFFEGSSLGQLMEVLAPFGHFPKIFQLMHSSNPKSRKHLLFSAAAERYNDAALSGKCPGIDPGEFSTWKFSNRSKFK